ncbi:cubilin-like protein [Dinothrombium tinctorium]|uniref:Cubilin-like protein n=1 Tax=Dinothrombium tinctorium TaxID=1965070 RepID=A0A3S4QXP9_9ACAR|nr:cubilin-like protein [Dinothrombium tinctorium]
MFSKFLLLPYLLLAFDVKSLQPFADKSDGGTRYFPGRYDPSSTKDCGGVINTAEGWIFSPNYPANYDDSISCSYIIKRFSPDVCKLTLHFIDFDIEDTSPNCDSDYLDLGQGYRMCGILISDTKKTITFPPFQTTIEFKFKSDAQHNRKGFMARVTQVPNSCKDGLQPTVRPPRPPTDDSEINTFQDSCDTFITGFGGAIRSPDYPNNYPTNKFCLYVFRRPNNGVCRVELTFNKFDIEHSLFFGSTGCDTDYLELPKGVKLCGAHYNRRPLFYPPGSDYMILTFKSDGTGTAPGFDIDVRQIPNSCNIFSPPRTYKCDYRLEGDIARIHSPGFPTFYGRNEQCVYFIKKQSYNMCYFTMEFVRFNLELSSDGGGNCVKDYMQLPDETFVFPREHDRYPIIYFSSDSYGEGRGYDILIKQLPCGPSFTTPIYSSSSISNGGGGTLPCDRIITDDDTLTSPDYPRDYGPLTRCIYTIYKSSSDVCELRLQFLYFDLEKTADCRSDYFLIEPSGEKLCGRDLREPDRVVKFPLGSRQLRLIFASDAQVQRPGFDLRIQQIRNSCHRPIVPPKDDANARVCEVSSAPITVLRSDNYPMPYNPNTNCVYKIYRAYPAVCTLELYFSDFSVGTWESKYCINDYVEIDGLKYCGVRRGDRVLVSFPRYLESVQIRFKTDSYDNYGGFRIEVKQISDKCNLPEQPKPSPVCDEVNSKQTFTISSPNYSISNYFDNADCHYTIKKSSYDVCALEVTYKRFEVEESQDCFKDYLEIVGVRLCGRLPYNSKRTYEFTDDEIIIKFHTDGDINASGFYASVRQVQC